MSTTFSPISVCRFPTKALLIDDNTLFSKELIPSLDHTKFTYQLYDNPEEALTFLTRDYKPDSFEKRLISQPDEKEWQHAMLDVNIYDLMKEVYNQNRFERISTVIVDFSMPGKNGLEVCEQITDPAIQKILLTGEGDEQMAVRAFNKGLIHQYIKKQDPDVLVTLNQSLLESQRTYFSKKSQLMFEAATFNPEMSCIIDPVFVNFFEKILKEKNIVEYYLLEITGTFLLLDERGNSYGLFTYTPSMIDMWNEDVPEIDNAPAHLAKDMRALKKMICFHNKDTYQIPSGLEWEKYAYPMNSLKGGCEPYYYACAQDMIDIEPDRVLSFHNFKNRKRAA